MFEWPSPITSGAVTSAARSPTSSLRSSAIATVNVSMATPATPSVSRPNKLIWLNRSIPVSLPKR